MKETECWMINLDHWRVREPWPGEGRGHINLPRVRLNIYLFCTTKVATNKVRNTFFLYKYPFTIIFTFLKTH